MKDSLLMKKTLFRDTIIYLILCVCLCYNCNRCYVSVCTFGDTFFLKLVPGSDFQFSGGQLTKKRKRKTQKVCKYVKQPKECESFKNCDSRLRQK